MDISSPENMKYAAGEMFKTLAGGYSPPPVYGGNYQFLPGVPPFTIYAVDAMLHDYQVKLALQMLYVPVMKPQFALVGDPEICQFVEETMRKIWTGHIIDISQAMPYTRFGAETLYKKDPKDNRAKFHKMMPFHPRDFRIITRDREIAGLKIVNTWNDFTQNAESGPKNGMTDAAGFYIMAPKSFVYVHERRHGSFQGRSVLEGSYEPWLEKTQEGGAISSRSMWFYRSAFDGGVLWYPPGESIDEFGNKVPNADVAMKILESVRNGNAIAMENVTDERGNPAWRYEKAQITQGGDVILKYIDHLDHKIISGAGLPDDVISQNSGTGSYAGRTIPFIAFLESGTPTVRAITNCIKDQLIQPLVVWNFGHERGNDWDITEAKVNVDQFLGGQGADAGKGVAGDGDGDGVPNEAGMPGGGNGMPKSSPKQMSIAQVEELLERNHIETTATNRNIFKNFGRLMGQSPEVSFVYEGRNRTSKIIGLPIQMSHDVSSEKRDESGKWTSGTPSANSNRSELAELQSSLESQVDGLKLDVSVSKDIATLSRIVVPKHLRSSGIGSKVMRSLIQFADNKGITIALSPSSDFGGNKNRLIDFYQRHGFVLNKGKNKDYSISESMYRVPQNNQMSHDVSDEKRDSDGKWTSGGTSVSELAKLATEKGWSKKQINQKAEQHGHDPLEVRKAAAELVKSGAKRPGGWTPRPSGKTIDTEKGSVPDDEVEKNRDAIHSKLTKLGAKLDNQSESGSRYYTMPNGQKVRIADHAPNEATQQWMDNNSVDGIRTDKRSWQSSLDQLAESHAKKTVNEMVKPHVTETPAFKKWFGDSKVVNDDGKPLVVYHGTNADFDQFDPSKIGQRYGTGYGEGFYFTENQDAASNWADENGSVMPVFLHATKLASRDDYIDARESFETQQEATDYLIRKGYDGVRDHVEKAWIVFHPNQIKSAIGNKGSFDPNDPRINMSQSDSESSGHWITIGGHGEGKESHGGTKVFIGRNGKILKGPAALKGENVGHIGKQKPLSEKEQQQIDHEKRLQSAGRLGKYTLHSSHDKELAKLKNDRQERVLTEAEKDRLIALDVSRHHDPHEVKQQGFRPEIVKHAAEIHKKARKTGELAPKPIDHASTREGIDARRAHAKAAGKTGHHYTEAEARKLGSKEHIEAHAHAKQIAKELGISTHDVLQNMESAHKYLQGEHGERESAKARARKLTGLNASNLAKIENAGGRDYSSVPGFDTASRTVAIESPGLGLDPDDTDTPAAVWDLIREGKMNAPKLHDRQTAHQAGQWIASAKKQKVAKSDHNPDEDTSFNFGFGKSDSNDDWGVDSGFDPMDFGLGILDE